MSKLRPPPITLTEAKAKAPVWAETGMSLIFWRKGYNNGLKGRHDRGSRFPLGDLEVRAYNHGYNSGRDAADTYRADRVR